MRLTAVILSAPEMKKLLGGMRTLTVQARELKPGWTVWVKEGWRGWNGAARSETQEKASARPKVVVPKHASKLQRQLAESLNALNKSLAWSPGGWADIDYRVDGRCRRIHGITNEQVNEAFPLREDRWRTPTSMPVWISRFQLKVTSAKRISPRRWKVRAVVVEERKAAA